MELITNPQEIVHNFALAQSRINETGKQYRIQSPQDLILKPEDFASAEEMAQQEAQIILNGKSTFTIDDLFRGIVYCLLTPMQKYQGQVVGFHSLFDKNGNFLDTSEESLANKLREDDILFHQQKARYILGARKTLEYDNSFLPGIQEVIGISKEKEIEIRKYLMKNFTGLGPKTSSLLLRMCGAQYLVPIDSWMREMLFFHGYDYVTERRDRPLKVWKKDKFTLKQRKESLRTRQYLEVEELATDLARKYDVPGFLLQLAFYVKNSASQK